MLIQVGDVILEIRPNQVFESDLELGYETLKKIQPKPVVAKKRRPKITKNKKESLHGKDNPSQSNNIR